VVAIPAGGPTEVLKTWPVDLVQIGRPSVPPALRQLVQLGQLCYEICGDCLANRLIGHLESAEQRLSAGLAIQELEDAGAAGAAISRLRPEPADPSIAGAELGGNISADRVAAGPHALHAPEEKMRSKSWNVGLRQVAGNFRDSD
jgi:hypothetical protein